LQYQERHLRKRVRKDRKVLLGQSAQQALKAPLARKASKGGSASPGPPGPGPSAPHLPFYPRWLENNLYSRVEYATEDLDRRTRHLRPPSPKRRTKPDQEVLDRALLELAHRVGPLKQSDDRAKSQLKNMGATTRQIKTAFKSLPAELRFGVGEK
jgi:hypothetical protein